jgi:phage tail-like protein
MAHDKDYQRASYPLSAYNFRVTIDGDTVGFSEVSGLKREYQTVTYRHGFSFFEGEALARYHIDKYIPITLKKGVVKGATFLHDWLERKNQSAVDISLCDEQGIPVMSWHIAKAIPVKLDAAAFNASGNDVSIDTLELMAAGISVEDHST